MQYYYNKQYKIQIPLFSNKHNTMFLAYIANIHTMRNIVLCFIVKGYIDPPVKFNGTL